MYSRAMLFNLYDSAGQWLGKYDTRPQAIDAADEMAKGGDYRLKWHMIDESVAVATPDPAEWGRLGFVIREHP